MIPVDSCCSLRGVSGIEILQSVCHLHSLNVSDGLDFSVRGWSFEEGQGMHREPVWEILVGTSIGRRETAEA